LVLGALVVEMQLAAGEEQFLDGVFTLVCGFGGGLGLFAFLGEDFGLGFGLGVRVDVVVLVPGRRVGGEDGVPDDGFGGGFRGARRGVDGFEVEEDLLGVPVEERGEICRVALARCDAAWRRRNLPVSRSNFTCAYSSFFML
jgi:hypothetical protein